MYILFDEASALGWLAREKRWKGMAVLLLLVTMIPLHAWGQRQWTLQQCLDYAMENNITLQKSRLQKQSATEDLLGAKGALLPSLSASTNQNVGYRPWQESGTARVTNGQVNTKSNNTYYNGSYGVNAQWTVWNGGKNRNTVRLDKLAEEGAELQIQETANTIQERITQLYTQILYLTENVKVNEQMLETAKKNEERGREMVEVGRMSKADLAQLTAQRATDEYNIAESRSQLIDYTLQLKQLLEITDEDAFEVVVLDISDSRILADIPALQSVYEAALASRPEIEHQKLTIKSSEVSLNIAKAGWLPSISMNGSLGASTNSLSSSGWGEQMKTSFDMGAGVSVSVPIFDGRSTKTAVNKARLQHQSAQLDLLDKQKTLYSTIQGFWLNAKTGQEKYKAASASVKSEQESYDLLSEQFTLGLKNIVELMTGKDNLLSAQQNLLQSKYTTIYNQMMLQFYQGQRIQ